MALEKKELFAKFQSEKVLAAGKEQDAADKKQGAAKEKDVAAKREDVAAKREDVAAKREDVAAKREDVAANKNQKKQSDIHNVISDVANVRNKIIGEYNKISDVKTISEDAKKLKQELSKNLQSIDSLYSNILKNVTSSAGDMQKLKILIDEQKKLLEKINNLTGEEELKKTAKDVSKLTNELDKMMPELMRVFVFNQPDGVYAQQQQFERFYYNYLLTSELFRQLSVEQKLNEQIANLLDLRDHAVEISSTIISGGKPTEEQLQYASENPLVRQMVRMYCNVEGNALEFYANNGFTDVRPNSIPVLV
ncbi:MAG: hypothetical protein QW500_00050 [Candidatus Micrarchaeia archaeon]